VRVVIPFALVIVPPEMVEIPARALGFLVGILRPHAAQKAEAMLRGWYWAHRLGAPGLVVGRHVIFDGPGMSFGCNVRLHAGSQYVSSRDGRVTIGDRVSCR